MPKQMKGRSFTPRDTRGSRTRRQVRGKTDLVMGMPKFWPPGLGGKKIDRPMRGG